MSNQEAEYKFQQMQENAVNVYGHHDEELIWLNATQQDLANPDRYIEWRVNDHETPGLLQDYQWYTASRLHTGETLYVHQAVDTANGFEKELHFATDLANPATGIHAIRYGIVDTETAVIFEIQLPPIFSIREEVAYQAYRACFDEDDAELKAQMEQLLSYYQERRETLRRFNLPHVGQVPPPGLIALSTGLKMLQQNNIQTVYMPRTLPLRHKKYAPEEWQTFQTQAINLFYRANDLISGADIVNHQDDYGYIQMNLGENLSSNHKLLQPVFE